MREYYSILLFWIAIVLCTRQCSKAFGYQDSPTQAQIDKEKVRGYIKILGSDKFDEREETEKRLVAMGSPILPFLSEAISNSDAEIRTRVLACITQIERHRDILALITKLKSKRSEQRLEAINGLIEFGAHAGSAVTAIVEALDDPDLNVRKRAVSACYFIRRDAKLAVPKLSAIAGDKKADLELRCVAVQILGELGDASQSSIPTLRGLLETENGHLKSNAIRAIGELKVQDNEVVTALLQSLTDNDSEVQGCAASALGDIGLQGKVVVPALIRVLQKRNKERGKPDRRTQILWGLKSFGKESKPAIGVMLDILKDQNESRDIRERCLWVLAAIGPEAKDAVPTLKLMLKNDRLAKLASAVETTLKAVQSP